MKFEIPILLQIARFFERKKKAKEENEKKVATDMTLPNGWALDPRKQRTHSLCVQCGNTKFFKRKNKMKCTKCGWKKRIPKV